MEDSDREQKTDTIEWQVTTIKEKAQETTSEATVTEAKRTPADREGGGEAKDVRDTKQCKMRSGQFPGGTEEEGTVAEQCREQKQRVGTDLEGSRAERGL